MKAKSMLATGYAEANNDNSSDLDSNGYFTNRGVVRGFKTDDAWTVAPARLRTMGYLSDGGPDLPASPTARSASSRCRLTPAVGSANGAMTTLNCHDRWNATCNVTLNNVPSCNGAPQTASYDQLGEHAHQLRLQRRDRGVRHRRHHVRRDTTCELHWYPPTTTRLKYTIDDCYLYQVDFNYDLAGAVLARMPAASGTPMAAPTTTPSDATIPTFRPRRQATSRPTRPA